jgi:murein DD-endopeptidase MepM/ murein hydrolase activator NlpD
MDRINERVTKKRFGTLVSPTNSPVSPEKFSGYHTAWDFETFADETDKAVTVTAFCGGKLVSKRTADGYGGVVVQECQLGTQAVTIIYGHLKLSSVAVNVGDYLAPGATIGQLGEAISPDTDGERKHLHFGIHKGTTIDIKGYVSTQAALSAWIDPNTYL